MNSKKTGTGFGFLTLAMVMLIGIIVLSACTYTIHENEYGYVTSMGKYKRIDNSAGLKFVTPFIDTVKIIPKNDMLYDIPPSEVFTGDKKTLVVDAFTLWRIEDPRLFMQKIGSTGEAQSRIDSSVYNALKNKLSTMKQEEIINADIGSIDVVNIEITKSSNDYLSKEYGIKIISTEIKRLDLPTANEEAVYNRMISERTQMAESFRSEGAYEAEKIKNETNKEARILQSTASMTAQELIGQGEGEYMKILSSAYSSPERQEFYQLIRSIKAMKTSMKGDKTIFLSKDSLIAKILNGTLD